MIAQLRAIAWLQLRLVKNSASRDLRWLGAFAWIIQVALATIGCLVLIVAAAVAGFFAFNDDNAWVLLLVLDGSLALLILVRMIMLLVELNETDFIDTHKFLFLPIRLRTLFAINFLVRNFTGLLLLSVPPLISLSVALSFMHGPQMLLGIPLGLAAIFAIAAAFDCLREWVLTFGESKAKMVMNLSVVFVSLLIGIAGLSGAFTTIRSESEAPRGVSAEKLAAMGDSIEVPDDASPVSELVHHGLERANAWIPLGWMPLGIYRLTEDDYSAALFGAIGLLCLGVGCIALDYRLVLGRYRDPKIDRDAGTRHQRTPASKLTRLSLRGVADARAAYAGLACLTRARSFSVRSSTGFYIVVAVVATVVPFVLDTAHLQSHVLADLVPFAVAGPVLFFSIALSNNIFGQDRSGFQVLVLLPVDRRTYLLSKNAVTTALVLAWTILMLLPCVWIFRPHPTAAVAAVIAALQAQLMLCVFGNGLSIVFPYRLKQGVLDQPAQPLAAILPNVCMLIVTPIVFTPMAIAAAFGPLTSFAWNIQGAWISLAVALLFLLATACVYAASLPGTTALLERRETRMLEILASDRE